MGKNTRPNAPKLQDILLEQHRQPAHNPYYPDLNASQPSAPPPYAEATGQQHRNHPNPIPSRMPTTNYSRVPSELPRQQTVIVQPQVSQYDARADRFGNRARNLNCNTMFFAIVTALSAIYAYGLYSDRPCIDPAVVIKQGGQTITVKDVQESHKLVTYGSLFVLFMTIAKWATGTSGKSHGCYIFFMSLTTFVMVIITGWLAYLAFFTPCSLKGEELVAIGLRSFWSMISDNVPTPDNNLFSDVNVINMAKYDRKGLIIFVIDAVNFIIYLCSFLSYLCTC